VSETPPTLSGNDLKAVTALGTDARPAANSLSARIGWTVLIVATLYVCYFSHLGALGFVGPDEPRYAWIARDMAETGDWVTPRLYGRPWFEKPVLYYWAAGLSFKIFGVSEAAARLPSALSALLATLALAWLALRVYGATTARWLLLLLPTTVGMIGFSRAAATDMPFSGMLTIAMVCAAVVLGLTRDEKTPILPRTPWVALLLFGFFLGLAVLAKGPAALVLAGGAIFFWAIFTKRWRDAFRLLHPVAILAFCASALPWYILCARRNADFFRVFIIEHNFKRFLTPEFQHLQPFWYYVPVLLLAFLPWTAMLLWSAAWGFRVLLRARNTNEMTGFLMCWTGFCVVFFSASHSKLPGYILPAIPPLGLLVAHTFIEMRQRYRISYRIVHIAAPASFCLIFALADWLARKQGGGNARAAGAIGVVVLIVALANVIVGLFGDGARSDMGAACAVLPVLVAMLFPSAFVPSYFRSDPSGRAIARELQRQRIPANLLAVTGMNRGLQYGLSFYLHDEIKNWDQNSETGGYLLTASKNCEGVVGPRFFCESRPFDADGTGRFLYLVIPIAHGN
jgi:4-amino-4-deoxy-L-arabinose transferase-like glycosyltransferase